MKNRIMKSLSWSATVVYTLMVMIFFYNWQGYAPLPGNDALMAWAVVATIAMAYLFIEYVDVKVEMTPLDASLETFVSYMPLGAYWSVLTAWHYGAINPSAFQWQAGLVFLAVVLIDVLGFSKVLFSKMMASFAGSPKTAK